MDVILMEIMLLFSWWTSHSARQPIHGEMLTVNIAGIVPGIRLLWRIVEIVWLFVILASAYNNCQIFDLRYTKYQNDSNTG